ncbi:conserved hypothetical protein; putative dimeric alpha+beta barrel [Bradyrhizobium sp. ORS 278]|uniref:hypothetical protein n=1 Tax=Bradyrhizobium sp. (strain ORS 278) TaxID=114615 RepID=UPI0001507C14|nr:hypothetical protein [Bradyrhizobium sp. ORS 278]CAL75726.1 conserved hypothetical protein; putative dimeric alpha+beta barrel [Bradyrhizobium sp. ORS 278]
MKILCIVTLSPTADRNEVARRLSEELRESWTLYAGGVIREAYATDDPTQVVFVLEAADIATAEAALGRLPLIHEGSFTLQLIALRPFSNWARLFATP